MAYTRFSDLYPQLVPLLDSIRSAAPTGTTIPKKVCGIPGGSSPAGTLVTQHGASAYSVASNKARPIIAHVVATLTDQQLNYLKGLGFSGSHAPKPQAGPPSFPALTSKQNDVFNSVFSSYDKVATDYMKNDPSGGDTARATLQKRLGQFDTAIETLGKTALPADT
jgi:hypothetical protein